MKKIGIISDTHGTFDEPLQEFLCGVDEIWHAGDIGSVELAERIAALKPLRAVHGNIDGGDTRRVFPEVDIFEREGLRIAMTHIGGYAGYGKKHHGSWVLQAHRPDIFVSGHSHILKVWRDPTTGTLCINPGAAGCYGFHRVRTAVRLVLDNGKTDKVEVGEWPR